MLSQVTADEPLQSVVGFAAVPHGAGRGDTLTADNGSAVVRYTWSLAGDELTLSVEDCQEQGVSCPDLDMVKAVNERTFTRSSTDAGR